MATKSILIFATKTERGTYLAATNVSPYFCVEADSEQELHREIERVAAFYERNRHAGTPLVSRDVSVTEFIPTKTFKRELQPA